MGVICLGFHVLKWRRVVHSKYLEKTQKPIELILFRQVTSYLATPSFMLDKNETVIFCNKAAEEVLGINFSELDEIHAEDILKKIKTRDKKAVSISKLISKKGPGRETIMNMHCLIETQEGQLINIVLSVLPIVNLMEEFCGSIFFFEETLP